MLIVGCLLSAYVCASAFTAPPVTQTTCGPVAGIFQDGAYSFRGIPYAEPPVGRLRWKPPRALSKQAGTCWNGTISANSYGNSCFQRNLHNSSIYEGNENCLFLNVITPTLDPGEKKPVMVWVHGGFLTELNGNFPTYSPTEQLVNETDVVYVGFNYRLQAFGFMALQLLADDNPTGTSGNYGFMDMILVLHWVQDNILNFGGDPNQVTIFGQSSGGTSIFVLLASRLCEGLFHKAWMMSASPLLNKTAAEAFKENEIFLKNTGCTTLTCLYALSPEDVTSSVPWDTYPFWSMSDQTDPPVMNQFDGALAIIDGTTMKGHNQCAWLKVGETENCKKSCIGHVLTESPFDAWTHGKMIDVPLLIGSCANEVDYFPVANDIKNWTWNQYKDHVNKTIGTFGDLIYHAALKLYPENFKTPEYQFTSLASDVRVNCPTDVMSLYAASTFNSSVYRYVVTSVPSQPVRPFGFPFPASYSFHAWDAFAFFGSVKDYIKNPSEEDFLWQRNVRDEVMSFVRSGYPSSSEWKPYLSVTALLSDNTTVIKTYHPAQCEFWLANNFYSYSWLN